MKIINIIFITLALISVTATKNFAQSQNKVSGKIMSNNNPIEFATVTLAKTTDTTKVLFYSTTDSVGHFYFQNIPQGQYKVNASLIGYTPYSVVISISPQNNPLVLTNIQLQQNKTNLNDVTVIAQKKIIQKTSEGFIVDATSNIAQAGGTATDLLKNTPTISVDADGVITMRGKTPLILINGRNSSLTNTDQIAASSIESIEIINNASAKYDANAEAGIINIKLKKGKANGTNGAVAMGAGLGSRGRYTGSLLLNHKSLFWNFGIAYDNRYSGRTKFINNNRTNFNLPNDYFLSQTRNDERIERLQNLKLNVDYAPNKKNSFSFEAIGNSVGQDNDEALVSAINTQSKNFNNANNRHSYEYQRSKTVEFAGNYTRKYANPKKELAINATYSVEQGRENTDILTQSLDSTMATFGNIGYQKTHNYEDASNFVPQIDFSTPLSKQSLLEVGYKSIIRAITANFQISNKIGSNYEVNNAASDVLKFNEQIHAAYAIYNSSIGKTINSKWKYQLGIRAETVDNNGNLQQTKNSFSNNFTNFFPSANIVYKSQNSSSVKLSYAKRINYPKLESLNPFTDITDSLNPHSGNPYLKPELINAYEISYNKNWKDYSVISNVFYRHSTNTIQSFFQLLPNGALLRLPQNIGTADRYGIENIIIGKPLAAYNFNASFTLFQQNINANNLSTDAVQNSFNWYAKLINNFTITKNAQLQLIANYNSALNTAQGKTIPLYNVDLGYQQKLGKGNTRLSLVVIDIFNTLKSGFDNYSTQFSSSKTSKADTRAFMLTFAYFFKTTYKEKLLENKFTSEF